MNGILSQWIMDLEKRQEILETEIKILKDTVWRLTTRVYHLEHFIHSQFVGLNDSPPPSHLQLPSRPRERDHFPHIRHHSTSTNTTSCSATSTITRPVESETPYQTVSLNLSNHGQERTFSIFSQFRRSPATSEDSLPRETRREVHDMTLHVSVIHPAVNRPALMESCGPNSEATDMSGARESPDASDQQGSRIGLSPSKANLIKVEQSPRCSPQLETADLPVYANEATETRELIIRKIPGHILTGHPHGLLTLHPSSEAQSPFHHPPFPISPRDHEFLPLSLSTGLPLRQNSPNSSTHHPDQPSVLQCEYCHKGFGSLGSLQLHLRLHTSLREKKYVCEFCSKRFKRSQELTVHRRVHTGEKPYSCPVCGKRFSQSSSVTLHMPVHTGEKPHICKHCAKPFSRLSHMKKHVKNIHQS